MMPPRYFKDKVEHEYVSDGTRVNPQNGGLGTDLTEEVGHFKY